MNNANAFGDIAYVCEWEGTPKNWKTIYQIKDKQIYQLQTDQRIYCEDFPQRLLLKNHYD